MEKQIGIHKGINGFALKMIAVVTMLIDHAAVALLEPIIGGNYNLYIVYLVLRCIGRLAFPIYCFLLVEGLKYTRNRTKYAIRLFVFSLISELPFDLALYNHSRISPIELIKHPLVILEHTNVFFTLFIGFLVIWGVDAVYSNWKESIGMQILSVLLIFVIIMAGVVVSLLLHTDYEGVGVAAITVLYLFREKPIVGLLVSICLLAGFSSPLELVALLLIVPLYFYNGTRGKQAKYVFYAFYPVHLAVLYLLAYLIL